MPLWVATNQIIVRWFNGLRNLRVIVDVGRAEVMQQESYLCAYVVAFGSSFLSLWLAMQKSDWYS